MSKVFTCVLIAVLLSSCDQVEKGDEGMTKKDIRAVLDAHSAGLLAIPGVTGVFVSELDDKTPCILVMVAQESRELAEQIPDSLESHPVKIVESGEFRPMDIQSSPR